MLDEEEKARAEVLAAENKGDVDKDLKSLEPQGADDRIAALETELDRIKQVREDQQKIINGLNKQLNLKLETLKDPEQYIPKKTAALEVYKEITTSKNTAIYSIIIVLLIAGSSAYVVFIGAIVAGIVGMGFAVIMMKKLQKMRYLEKKYNLTKPGFLKKA